MKDPGESLDQQSMMTLALRAHRDDVEVRRTFVYFMPFTHPRVPSAKTEAVTQKLPPLTGVS